MLYHIIQIILSQPHAYDTGIYQVHSDLHVASCYINYQHIALFTLIIC